MRRTRALPPSAMAASGLSALGPTPLVLQGLLWGTLTVACWVVVLPLASDAS